MKDELQNYLERPKRYEHIDGTGEISMGVMLLGFALLSYLQAALPEGSMWRNGFASLLFMYLILIPVLALGLLVIDLIVPGDVVELFRPVSLLVGLTWLGSGVATLYSYIRHTQPPALEAE